MKAHTYSRLPLPLPEVQAARVADFFADKSTIHELEARIAAKHAAAEEKRKEARAVEKEATAIEDEVAGDDLDGLPSDGHSINDGMCVRCTLLFIRDNPSTPVDFEFNLTVRQVNT